MNLPAALLSSVGFGFGTAAGPCNRKKTKEQAELQSAALYRDDNCSNALSLSLSLLFPLCHCLFRGKCAVTISEHDDDAKDRGLDTFPDLPVAA